MTQISVPLFTTDSTQSSPHGPLQPVAATTADALPPHLPQPGFNQSIGGCDRASLGALWSMPNAFTVSTKEAAAMLGRSKRTLEGWRLRHTGPAYQAGGRVTYTIGDLKAYLASLTVRPTAHA